MTTLRDYVFYKFVCLNDDIDSCYVGSTGDFKKRRTSHKHKCHNESRKEYNIKLYQTIRENGGWDNWKMVQIGSKDQITKREAEQIEEQYRKELKADMNERRAFRTEEECIEQRQKCDKEYYENNREKILEQRKERNKEYYKNNKAEIGERTKAWHKNNKEYHNKICNEWYKNNREYQCEKIECECGSIVTRYALTRHKKTMLHQLKLLEIGETSE